MPGVAAPTLDRLGLPIETANAKIKRLEDEVNKLREELRRADIRAGDTVAADINAAVAAEGSSRFVPVAATDCYGVKPCLHSTAAERVAAGCLEAVWEGHFGDKPTEYRLETIKGNATQHRPDFSYMKPVAPKEGPRPTDVVTQNRFRPSIGEQCDLSDVWAVTLPGHVKEAIEAHWHQRLRGLKNTLWLQIGTSIDHFAMKEACAMFSATRTTVEAKPTIAHPMPTPLLVDSCHVPSLNFTFAHVAANGFSSTWLQRNASLQPTRFHEIALQLRRIKPHGWYGGPTFLIFGGMEWDFKNWRCAFPKTRQEWRVPLGLLHMQIRHARNVWPSDLKAVFARTMFTPTYGSFGCPCCANESHFTHYNYLLRSAAKPEALDAYFSGRDGNSKGGSSGSGSSSSTDVKRVEATCTPLHVLDLQRMMLCNNTCGSCSSRSGWSTDGLHPSRPVLLQYVSLALNLMADLGEYCSGGSGAAAAAVAAVGNGNGHGGHHAHHHRRPSAPPPSPSPSPTLGSRLFGL